MRRETDFFELLNAARSYERSDGQLVLATGDGRTLVLRAR
jgi:hypothetical protein